MSHQHCLQTLRAAPTKILTWTFDLPSFFLSFFLESMGLALILKEHPIKLEGNIHSALKSLWLNPFEKSVWGNGIKLGDSWLLHIECVGLIAVHLHSSLSAPYVPQSHSVSTMNPVAVGMVPVQEPWRFQSTMSCQLVQQTCCNRKV